MPETISLLLFFGSPTQQSILFFQCCNKPHDISKYVEFLNEWIGVKTFQKNSKFSIGRQNTRFGVGQFF
jgi:hypothetical protein